MRALLLAALLSAPASAELLLAPQFQLTPKLELSETYRSNLFLRPSGEVGSWIHEINPSLRGVWTPADLHRVEGGYDLEYQAYSKDPSLNNTFNHYADLLYTYENPGGLTTRLKDGYVNTVDPPNSEQTARLRRWQNRVSTDLEYRLGEDGPFFAGADASHFAFNYIADVPQTRELLNRYEQYFGGRFGYYVQPKTRLYVGYRRGIFHYTATTSSPTKNHKSHNVVGGVEAQAWDKVVAQAEAGGNFRKYDDEILPGEGTQTEVFTALGRLIYRPLDRTRIEASVERGAQEATFAGSRYYVATGGALSVTHQFPSRFGVSVYGAAERDAFTAQGRLDRIYQGRLSLDYELTRYAKFSGYYFHRSRFSNFSQFQYRDHVGGLSVALTL